MAAKEKVAEKPDLVHQNAIHVETIRKEQKHQILHTEFNINPHRRLDVLPDKPMVRKPPELVAENLGFVKAFHEARREPTKKYPRPQTSSQEIGWLSTPLIPSDHNDKRLNFYRSNTDVTRHKESLLRSTI